MLARLDVDARETVLSAHEEARALRHAYTGTEHLLLSMLRPECARTAHALGACHVTYARARHRIESMVGSGEENVAGGIPFTPRATRALQFALSDALRRRHERVSVDDLLLGLIRAGDGTAVDVLSELDADPATIRAELMR